MTDGSTLQNKANQTARDAADTSKKLSEARQVALDANANFFKIQSDGATVKRLSVDAQAALKKFDAMQSFMTDSGPAKPPNQRNNLLQAQADAGAKQAEYDVQREAATILKDEADLKVSQLEVLLKNQQDKAAIDQSEADDKAALAALLKLGVVGRASQVPANVNACVVAMGK